MKNPVDYIEEAGKIAGELEALGLLPVMVGGMALVVLGSRRVTRDFDFLIPNPASQREALLKIFYQRGFELASKINEKGDIVRTMDNRNIAAMRLRLDAPSSIYFLNKKTGLRMDLLFDFPLPAREVAQRATKKKIRRFTFYIASPKDLLRLKEIACKERSLPADAEDLEFLKKLTGQTNQSR